MCIRDRHECDDYMLKKLDVLEPENNHEKIDRKLVKSLIETKRKLGLGIEWSDSLTDELHNPIRKHFKKRKVFAKKANDIMAAYLVDMQYFAKGNKGFCYILIIIDIFSKYGYAIPLRIKQLQKWSKRLNNYRNLECLILACFGWTKVKSFSINR